MMRRRWLLALLLLVLLAGCGQKGDLYLPPQAGLTLLDARV